MKIVSLLASVLPERLGDVQSALANIAGLQLHGEAARGKLVVTIEGDDGEDLMPGVMAVQRTPGVLATMLTYEYCDEAAGPQEASQ